VTDVTGSLHRVVSDVRANIKEDGRLSAMRRNRIPDLGLPFACAKNVDGDQIARVEIESQSALDFDPGGTQHPEAEHRGFEVEEKP